MNPFDPVDFWFAPGHRPLWFARDAGFDARIRARFLPEYEAAAAGMLNHWTATPRGSLALVLLLDQFPRNMFRDTPRAFATDAQALLIARMAVDDLGYDHALATEERRFLFLPFEHSEDLADQQRAVALFERWNDDPEGLDFARRHLAIIERFGRFPHRNAILGRSSTPVEEQFLAGPGSRF